MAAQPQPDRGYLEEHDVRGTQLFFDLNERLQSMLRSEPSAGDRWGEALVNMGGLHIVLTVLRQGARLTEHSVRGPMAVQVLGGRVRLELPDEQRELTPAQLGIVDGEVRHALEALQDSAILIITAITGPQGADIGAVEGRPGGAA